MLFENNGREADKPVPHKSEEVLEDDEEVIATCDGTNKVDDDNHTDPEITGNSFAVSTKNLATEGSCIRSWNAVRNDTQSDDHAAEFAEATEVAETCQNHGTGRNPIGVRPSRRCADARAEAYSNEGDKNK